MNAQTAPVDARQVRTRSKLLDTLLRLLEDRPFDQITIREIAREAEIGYATFFRHYPSKEALLHDLAAGEISAMLQRTMKIHAKGDARSSCVALFEHVGEHRALWAALLTGGAAATVKQEFLNQALALTEQYEDVTGDIPGDVLAVFSTSSVVEMIAWWLGPGSDYSTQRMGEIMYRLAVAPTMEAGGNFS